MNNSVLYNSPTAVVQVPAQSQEITSQLNPAVLLSLQSLLRQANQQPNNNNIQISPYAAVGNNQPANNLGNIPLNGPPAPYPLNMNNNNNNGNNQRNQQPVFQQNARVNNYNWNPYPPNR